VFGGGGVWGVFGLGCCGGSPFFAVGVKSKVGDGCFFPHWDVGRLSEILILLFVWGGVAKEKKHRQVVYFIS